ncbi:GNAT family N-acetyltransferase [Clostridium sp.]
MDLRLTFNEVASEYDRMRPLYVNELFDDVIKFTGLCSSKDALEIGFAMYGVDIGDNTMCLFRFMIDEKYQGKCYGKVALADLLNKIRYENAFNEIWLSFHPESIIAARLYSSFGFKQKINGLETEDEIDI